MDTLCIPVNQADESLKMQTIHGMAPIYAMAYSVLVLDLGLMSLTGARSRYEIYAHTTCSVWTRRIWTFQVVLAERSIIQFFDQALVLEQIDRPDMTSVRET
jgi:hypothetical protein